MKGVNISTCGEYCRIFSNVVTGHHEATKEMLVSEKFIADLHCCKSSKLKNGLEVSRRLIYHRYVKAKSSAFNPNANHGEVNKYMMILFQFRAAYVVITIAVHLMSADSVHLSLL
jgi:hypothetical protein